MGKMVKLAPASNSHIKGLNMWKRNGRKGMAKNKNAEWQEKAVSVTG